LLEDEVDAASSFLVPWERSVARRGDVATSAGGEAAPKMGKGGDDASWADPNFKGLKNEENLHDRFSCYKWTVKI
jgi:hypothetical protein